MTGRVAGKAALITGAARGQGRSHALRLAREGADIIAVDACADIESNGYPLATPDDLAQTVRGIEELDRRVFWRRTDVRDRAALIDAVEAALPHLGPGGAGYSWPKRAVATFVHSLALQLAPYSIRVNAVHPTNCDTDMLQSPPMYGIS